MAEKHSKWEVIDVRVEDLNPGLNVRKDPREKTLPALGDSLAVRQHHPIIIDPDRTIVDGWRRFLAAKLRGLATLKAIVTDKRVSEMSETDLRLAQISMAHHTENLSGFELYEGCYALLQLNLDWTGKMLAERLNIDPSMMTRILATSKCTPEVRAAFRERKIGTGTVYAISKYPEDVQPEVLRMKLAGASRDQLESQRRKKKAKKRNGSISKQGRVALTLPSGATATISHVATLEELIQTLTEIIREAKRGQDQRFDLKTLETVLKRRATASAAPEVANA